MSTPRAEYPTCGTCHRMLDRGDQDARCPLPAADFCGNCARPISQRGMRLGDNAGFVAFAHALTGRRPARPVNVARSLPEAG